MSPEEQLQELRDWLLATPTPRRRRRAKRRDAQAIDALLKHRAAKGSVSVELSLPQAKALWFAADSVLSFPDSAQATFPIHSQREAAYRAKQKLLEAWQAEESRPLERAKQSIQRLKDVEV